MSVRIGFIGTGGIAQSHLRTLSGNADAQLIAYCDLDLARAQKAAEEYGGNAYRDFEKMLDGEDLDALVICTPPFAHGDIELAACEQGLHMLIEKPVAISTQAALPILAAVEQAGVTTVVAYKYRWEDHVQKGREMLADQTIGLVFGNFWGGIPGVGWWRVKSESGGQMIEQATHIVDMARFMVGDVQRVQAFGTLQAMNKVYPDFDVWDATVANLEFVGGAVGTISCTCLSENWGQSSLRVIAQKITVEVKGGEGIGWVDQNGEGQYEKQVDGYQQEAEVFVEAVMTGDRSKVYSDYADAVKTLAVTEATNLSIQNGGEVVEISDILG